MQGKPRFRDYGIVECFQVNVMPYSAPGLMVSISNMASCRQMQMRVFHAQAPELRVITSSRRADTCYQ